MTQKRKRLSGPEKLAIVKRYLVERVPTEFRSDHDRRILLPRLHYPTVQRTL